MHAQHYLFILESLSSVVLGRWCCEYSGVDDSSDSELELTSESRFTSTPRTMSTWPTLNWQSTLARISTPKAHHRQSRLLKMTIYKSSSSCLHLTTRLDHTNYDHWCSRAMHWASYSGCARRRISSYRMHVIYSAFWISAYDTLSIIYSCMYLVHVQCS